MLEPGSLLQGRYEIERELARGGMGAVYAAFDKRFRNRVAVKESFFASGELARAFEHEARLLRNLKHEGLPGVIDYFDDGGAFYLVMDFVEGDDLATALAERVRATGSALPLATVVDIGTQLLDVLAFLHEQPEPIVHRDVKPQNLKLTPRGCLVVLDLGLAKGSAADMSRLASGKSVDGYTPGYAPLEQMAGSGTDPRSDLYSAGATLYTLATGVRPAGATERSLALAEGEPDPLLRADAVRPELPGALADALEMAMRVSPKARPQSARAMRAMLLEAAAALRGDGAAAPAGAKGAAGGGGAAGAAGAKNTPRGGTRLEPARDARMNGAPNAVTSRDDAHRAELSTVERDASSTVVEPPVPARRRGLLAAALGAAGIAAILFVAVAAFAVWKLWPARPVPSAPGASPAASPTASRPTWPPPSSDEGKKLEAELLPLWAQIPEQSATSSLDADIKAAASAAGVVADVGWGKVTPGPRDVFAFAAHTANVAATAPQALAFVRALATSQSSPTTVTSLHLEPASAWEQAQGKTVTMHLFVEEPYRTDQARQTMDPETIARASGASESDRVAALRAAVARLTTMRKVRAAAPAVLQIILDAAGDSGVKIDSLDQSNTYLKLRGGAKTEADAAAFAKAVETKGNGLVVGVSYTRGSIGAAQAAQSDSAYEFTLTATVTPEAVNP